MSTGELIAGGIGAAVGAAVRQPEVTKLRAQVAWLVELVQSSKLALDSANETITDLHQENARLRRSEAAKDAEIARLLELVPPEEP